MERNIRLALEGRQYFGWDRECQRPKLRAVYEYYPDLKRRGKHAGVLAREEPNTPIAVVPNLRHAMISGEDITCLLVSVELGHE